MRLFWAVVCAVVPPALMLGLQPVAPASPESCAALAALELSDVTVASATVVDAGAFLPPGAGANTRAARPFGSLPAFCRVAATLEPSSDSDIKVEVWMPIESWNGKFMAVGNGAFNGTIAYPAMASALDRGYATASTDTGHVGGSASFALGHPEKVIDFGWRAVHEMTVFSKQIVGGYYLSGPRFSYWNGCSAGGRQAMKEAQRFPDDYDGIIAGAPGLDWTGRAAQAVRVAQALEHNQAARLTSVQTRLLHEAVVNACDADDGLADGLIENPERCSFDPGELQCSGSADDSCLSPAQVTTARMLYSSRPNPGTQREITALARGSELGWIELGWTASARRTGLDQFRFLVFQDPEWDVDRFSFDADIVRAEEVDDDTINALDPDLSAFMEHGGKLLHYHGWSDPQISPGNSTQYYRRVVAAAGGPARVQDSYRLFMAPGMAHCRGGEGPNSFDAVAALEQWVEQGDPPDRIIASQVVEGRVVRTRPLCPYPQLARYNGSGSPDDASSFACVNR